MSGHGWLKIQPLGGVRQIGANMTLITTPQQEIIFDAGLSFPHEDLFDIDYLIPDWNHLRAPSDIIITHGHEDHIGGIGHLLERFPNIKVHASPLAAALIRKKLERLKIDTKINLYYPHSTLPFADFDIYPIHVNHSIPESCGLLLKSNIQSMSLFYLSDFKVDQHHPYEPPCDFVRAHELTQGLSKRLLLVDSTNMNQGKDRVPSERDLFNDLDKLIRTHDGRIFVTLFASNIHRLQTLFNMAKAHRRKVVPHGQSMNHFIKVSSELGILKDVDGILLDKDSLRGIEKNLIVLLSGPQGDFKGALRRVAMGDDPTFKPGAEDRFIFSCKIIPGNERKIHTIVNKLYEWGAQVYLPGEHLIHASGHAGYDDLRTLCLQYQPTDIIPIHGESSALSRHQAFLKNEYPHVATHLIYNFDTLSVTSDLQTKIQKNEEPRPIFIHGNSIVIEPSAISERRKMATRGLVVCSIHLDNLKKHKPALELQFLGLPAIVEKHRQRIEDIIVRQLKQMKVKTSKEQKEKETSVQIKRYLAEILGYRPVAIVHLT
ncbi:MAG: ribonuclease J [Pseudomonadota bacterium]